MSREGRLSADRLCETKTYGKWIVEICCAPKCTFCGGETHYTDDSDDGYFVYPFCPYCGKPMETEYKSVSNWWEEEDEEDES